MTDSDSSGIIGGGGILTPTQSTAKVAALWARMKDRDIASLGPEGLALFQMQVLGQGARRKKVAANPVLAQLRLQFKSPRRYYPSGDSYAITAAALQEMTPKARKLVAACLWLLDFKWLSGTRRKGYGTHAHFGYDAMHGSYPHTSAFLESTHIRMRKASRNSSSQETSTSSTSEIVKTPWLCYTMIRGDRIVRKYEELLHIEVPLSTRSYIMIPQVSD